MIVDELVAMLSYDLKGEGDLKRFNQGLDNAERGARRSAAAMVAMGTAIGTFVGTLAVQAVNSLASAVGSIPGDVLKVGQTFENLETVLTTIEGSSDKAKASMNWVEEFAKTTPYDLGQVSEAFVRMRAYGLNPMDGSLKRIGDAAAGMGKGLMQGVEAIADAVSGENERLKEFGIKSKVQGDKITYSWNENGKDMSKTVRKNGTEITKALMEIFGRFDGAMDALSGKQAGIIANLGDEWTSFLKLIGEKGYYDDVTQRLKGLKETIEQWSRDGILDRAATAISRFLTGSMEFGLHVGGQLLTIGKGAFYAANGIVELISRVTGLNKAASLGVLAGGALAMTAGGRGMLAAIAKRVPALAALLLIDDIMTGVKGGNSYIGTLTGGQEALDGLRAKLTEVSEAFNALSSAMGSVTKIDFSGWNLSEFINQELVKFVDDLAKVFNDLAAALNAVASVLGTKSMDEARARGDRMSSAIEGVAPQWMKDAFGWGADPKGGRVGNEPFDSGRFGSGLPPYLDDAMRNYVENQRRSSSGAAAAAAVNDNSMVNSGNVKVEVGGVTVNGVAGADAIVGAKVGSAIGNSAAGAAKLPPTRTVGSGAF